MKKIILFVVILLSLSLIIGFVVIRNRISLFAEMYNMSVEQLNSHDQYEAKGILDVSYSLENNQSDDSVNMSDFSMDINIINNKTSKKLFMNMESSMDLMGMDITINSKALVSNDILYFKLPILGAKYIKFDLSDLDDLDIDIFGDLNKITSYNSIVDFYLYLAKNGYKPSDVFEVIDLEITDTIIIDKKEISVNVIKIDFTNIAKNKLLIKTMLEFMNENNTEKKEITDEYIDLMYNNVDFNNFKSVIYIDDNYEIVKQDVVIEFYLIEADSTVTMSMDLEFINFDDDVDTSDLNIVVGDIVDYNEYIEELS